LLAIIAAAALAASDVSMAGAPAGARAVDDDFATGLLAVAAAAGFFAGVGFFSLDAVSLFFFAMGCNSFRVSLQVGDCTRPGFCLPETRSA
jgi:hypothetical protein